MIINGWISEFDGRRDGPVEAVGGRRVVSFDVLAVDGRSVASLARGVGPVNVIDGRRVASLGRPDELVEVVSAGGLVTA